MADHNAPRNDAEIKTDHEETYKGFMAAVKWGIPFALILFGIVISFTT